MNIKEINNNKTVKKIKMKCDNYKTDIDGKFMIPRNGFYIISGSAGSGDVVVGARDHTESRRYLCSASGQSSTEGHFALYTADCFTARNSITTKYRQSSFYLYFIVMEVFN